MAEKERRKPAPLRMTRFRPGRRALWLGVREFALCCLLATGIIYGLQDRMIYHPQTYSDKLDVHSARPLADIDYRIAGGAQRAYYAAPAGGGVPSRLWLTFGGNGALILMYHHLVERPELADTGILMIDYPGYGANAGKPSGKSIQQGANAALAALAARLGTTPEALLPRTGVFGHSLGTGAALEFALAHPQIQRIVLVAPFTSLYDMAFRVVGPIALLLHHDFANEAVLKQLGARGSRPQVEIVTGDKDQVIPIAMSRRLKAENPWVTYKELPGYEHNHIVTEAAPRIASDIAAMP